MPIAQLQETAIGASTEESQISPSEPFTNNSEEASSEGVEKSTVIRDV
jgi:hypothetical protein